MFSERFYSHLQKPGCDKYGVYDLAYAVREAVVDVMHPWELRHPFHWASFVLHGAWFLNGEI
jgi:CHAT domain-containing protein